MKRRPPLGGLGRRLDDRRTTIFLLLAHAALIAASFVLMPTGISGDQTTYLALARGLEQGAFSDRVGQFDPPPINTYRTQGYPAFIAGVRWFSERVCAIPIAQGVLHFVTLLIAVSWLRRSSGSHLAGNVALMLLLPQVQLLFYVQMVFPETLMAFLCMIAVHLGTEQRTGWGRSMLLAAVLSAAFWVRPVVLLFPVAVLLGDLLFLTGAERWSMLRWNALTGALFLLLGPLPFGLWNARAHDHFKMVPIAGSAVISNMGFWQLRLPGYGSMHYFDHTRFGNEFFVSVEQEEAARHYLAFQAQWARIDSAASPHMTATDIHDLPVMNARRDSLYLDRSAAYAIALDEAINRETLKSIAEEPGYYALTRLYTALRLWITNINIPMEKVVFRPGEGRPVFGRPGNAMEWLKALGPFVLSLVTFGIGLVLLVFSVVRERKVWKPERFALYIIAYLWLIHVPMAIQSRYLVPVHAVAIACIALSLARSGRRQRATGSERRTVPDIGA